MPSGAGKHHLRIASGRDYRDAAPVRGVRLGGMAELLEVEVDITDASRGAQ